MTILPTLKQLFTGIINSIGAQFGITLDITDTKSFYVALGGVWSGQVNALYKFQGSIQKNTTPLTADPRSLGGTLNDWGEILIERDQNPATQGQYTCSVAGTMGGVIAANTTYLSDADSLNPNILFILDNDYVLPGSSGTITLRATVPGTTANLAVGNTLTCTKPLVNVTQVATVTAITVNAVDAETVPQYRAVMLKQYRLAPQGGAVPDYIVWGDPVAGVARIYPYTAGVSVWEVDVYVEADLSDSGGSAPDYNFGIPTSTILNNVTAALLADPISGAPRKPMGVVLSPANVGAIAVTVYQVVITFTGTSGITSDQKLLIAEALQQAINNIRPYIAGADDPASQNDTLSINLPVPGPAIPEQYMVVVIASQAVPGALFTGASMTVNGTPETAYTFDTGIIPYLSIDGGAGYGNVIFT